jgi:hypothetical protein
MEFSYKPVNPFQKDELSSEDKAMIDGMRNTAYICGCRGGDVEFAVNKALKRMGRFDLLPPCEQSESEEETVEHAAYRICKRFAEEIEEAIK